jgi:hypothetical protein
MLEPAPDIFQRRVELRKLNSTTAAEDVKKLYSLGPTNSISSDNHGDNHGDKDNDKDNESFSKFLDIFMIAIKNLDDPFLQLDAIGGLEACVGHFKSMRSNGIHLDIPRDAVLIKRKATSTILKTLLGRMASLRSQKIGI